MVAFTKPQQWKKRGSERLRSEGDQDKFIDLSFIRWQVLGFGKDGKQEIPPIASSCDKHLAQPYSQIRQASSC